MIAPELPGGDLVAKGIHDLEGGVETVESLLVSIAAPRLVALGLVVSRPYDDAEIRLYRLLAREHGAAAHAKYNALLRRLVSFQRAFACAS